MSVRGLGGSTAVRGLGGDLAVAAGPRTAPERKAQGASAAPRRRWGLKRKAREVEESTVAATWTAGSSMGTRAVSWALMGALACGPAALAWTALRPEPAAPAVSAAGYDERLMVRRSVAVDAAGSLVRRWLGATAGNPQGVDRLVGAGTLPRSAPSVVAVEPVKAVASAPGVWAVTVGADVVPVGAKGAVRRFYQVLVAVSGEGEQVAASPMGLPQPVAGPAGASPKTGSYGVTASMDGAVAATVRSYLQAAFAGQGDVARYVAPGSSLRGLDAGSGAYAAVSLREVRADGRVAGITDGKAPGDGAQLHVQATFDLVDTLAKPAESALPAAAALTLTARGGRWEVSAVDTKLAEPGSGPAASTK